MVSDVVHSDASAADPIVERLEDQIGWYDRKSIDAQRTYKRIKVTEIMAAALIPFLAALQVGAPYTGWMAGVLGVVVTVLEGLLQLNQYQHNWISYRSICEALRHEKYLYLGQAGPYAAAANPHALLAERIESQVSQENAKWAAVQQQQSQRQQPGEPNWAATPHQPAPKRKQP
jgi:hypothetical protein